MRDVATVKEAKVPTDPSGIGHRILLHLTLGAIPGFDPYPNQPLADRIALDVATSCAAISSVMG
jgi:hypothetical protein